MMRQLNNSQWRTAAVNMQASATTSNEKTEEI
jgi:hypothetical protein